MVHGTEVGSRARISQAALEAARSRIELARGEFHYTEEQLLKVLDQICETGGERITDIAKLEGFRAQLMASFDGFYRKSLNNLVDSLLASIGEAPRELYDADALDEDAAESPV